MRILWIEDDPNISEKEFFGSNVFKAHEIVQIREFETASRVITEDLEQYDYIIIDINLENSPVGDLATGLMDQFNLTEKAFLEEAGFHLYIQLMEKGFPKKRIIFFTANASSEGGQFKKIIYDLRKEDRQGDKDNWNLSIGELRKKLSDSQNSDLDAAMESDNLDQYLSTIEAENSRLSDTENTYENLEEQFHKARIDIPNKAISKNKKRDLDQWFQPRINFDPSEHEEDISQSQKNYLLLRRGMLNVIENFKNEENLEMNHDFIGDYNKLAFLEGLSLLLQAHELLTSRSDQFYLILCDYITKPFEKFLPKDLIPLDASERSCRFPAYLMRNWIAHGLFHSKGTLPLDAQDSGFVFLIVMQSLFNRNAFGNGKDFKQLFGELPNDKKNVLNQLVEMQISDYRSPYKPDKLLEICDKGQKEKNKKWEKENFLMHFYCSYLLASVQLVPRKLASGKEFRDKRVVNKSRDFEDRYEVHMNYKLEKTSFLYLASKKLQEIKNDSTNLNS